MVYDYLVPIYNFLDPIFLVYFSIINLIYTVLFVIGAFGTFKRMKEINTEDLTSILKSNSLPEITFIVPTYNDGELILACVSNLTNLSYRYKQIIVVNDGSTDDTFPILFEALQLKSIPVFFNTVLPSKRIRGVYRSALYHEVVVIDKVNGQKYDALNAALNACQTDYFIIMDSDTYVEDSEFESLIRPIFSSPQTIAVGAAVKIFNGCQLSGREINTSAFPVDFIAGVQGVEYLRAFLMRVGWDFCGCNYIISGAFGVFIKDVVIRAGGFGPTIANDMEVIFRLNRTFRATDTPYKIVYLPDPVAWTMAPKTWKELADQRIRWHRGLLECLWFHKSVLFNPKYGRQGLIVHPFLLLFEAFEPLVELFGYVYIIVGLIFGVVNPFFLFSFLTLTMGFVFIQTLFCLLMEEFSFRKYPSVRSIVMLFVYSLIENLGYRQMTLIWRAKGFIDFIRRYDEIREDGEKLNVSINQTIKKGKIY